MKRRQFLKNIGWVGTGLVVSPTFVLAGQATTSVLTIPSEVQIRHGLFNLALPSETSPYHWTENIRHNRFLANGYAIEKGDLISYSFKHLQQNYQLLYKKGKCYWYPPDSENAILLQVDNPYWENAIFEVNLISDNTTLRSDQTCYLLPLEDNNIIHNQVLKEGQILQWEHPNHYLEITKPLIIIKQKN